MAESLACGTYIRLLDRKYRVVVPLPHRTWLGPECLLQRLGRDLVLLRTGTALVDHGNCCRRAIEVVTGRITIPEALRWDFSPGDELEIPGEGDRIRIGRRGRQR